MSRTDEGQEREKVNQAHFVEANKEFDSFYPEVTEVMSVFHILFVLLVTIQTSLVSNSLLISQVPKTCPTLILLLKNYHRVKCSSGVCFQYRWAAEV